MIPWSHVVSRVFGTVVAATAWLLAGTASAGAAGTVPFADPAAHGYIGFCDMAGHNVVSGNINTRPFVWRAVSSVAPPRGYRGHGENTSLDVFQPRPDVPASEFSGDQLEGTSLFNDPKHATAQATYKDLSLRTIIHEYPPLLHGLYQLRMPFGKVGYGTYDATYPATVIQVTGNTWRVVSGGLVDCNKARGGSTETILAHIPVTPHHLVIGMTAPTAPAADRASNADSRTKPPTSGNAAGSSSSSGAGEVVDQPFSAPIAVSHPTSSGISAVTLAVIVIAGLLLLALLCRALQRRGHRTRTT